MPQNQHYKSVSTAGGGDCAFHAIFGDYDGIKREFFCKNVADKRKKVAELITQQYLDSNNDELISVINTGLFEMGNTSEEASSCPNIIALKEYLDSKKHENTVLYKDLLGIEIQNNHEFYDKINAFLTANPPKIHIRDDDILGKFMYFISKNTDFVIQKAIETCSESKKILEAYSNYKKAIDSLRDDSEQLDWLIQEYFSKFTNAKKKVLQELADKFISRPGAWLPQHFIRAVAISSNKIIHFYINDTTTKQLNGGKEYKGKVDEATQEVRIYFNGHNHYERVVDLNWSPANSYQTLTSSKQTLLPEKTSSVILAGRTETVPTPFQVEELHPRLPLKDMQLQPTIKLPVAINNQQLKEHFEKLKFTKQDNMLKYKNKTTSDFKKTGILGEIITTRQINNNDQVIPADTTLAAFRPSSVECKIMQNSTNNNGKVLLGEQQQILLDFLQLYSKQAIEEKSSSPIVIEADNFNPEDLQVLLETLINKPIPLISLALPPKPKNVNQQPYTAQDINKINQLITQYHAKQSTSFMPKKPSKKLH